MPETTRVVFYAFETMRLGFQGFGEIFFSLGISKLIILKLGLGLRLKLGLGLGLGLGFSDFWVWVWIWRLVW